MTTYGAWRDSLVWKAPNNNGYGGPDFPSICFGIYGPNRLDSGSDARSYRNAAKRADVASGAVAGATWSDVTTGGYNAAFASIGRTYDYPSISYQAWDFNDAGVATITLPDWVEAGDTFLCAIHGAGPGPDLPAGWTVVNSYAGGWGQQMIVKFTASGPSQVISWTYNGSGCGEWALGGICFQGAASFGVGASNEDTDGGSTFTTVGGQQVQAMFSGEGYANHGMILQGPAPAGYIQAGSVANVISTDLLFVPDASALTFAPWTGSNDYDRSIAITHTSTVKDIGTRYYEQGVFYGDVSYIEYPLDRDGYGRDYMDNRWLNGIRADPTDPDVADPDFIGYSYEDDPHHVVATANSSSYPFAPYIYYAFGTYDSSTNSYGKGVKRATEMVGVYLDIELMFWLKTGSASEKSQEFKIGFVPSSLRTLVFDAELEGNATGVDGIRCGNMFRTGHVSLPAWVRNKIAWASLGSFNSPNGIPSDSFSGNPTSGYGWDSNLMKAVRFNGWTSVEPGNDRLMIPYAQLDDHTYTLIITAAGQDNSSMVVGTLGGPSPEAKVYVGKIRGGLAYKPIMKWRPAFKDPVLDLGDKTTAVHFSPA